MKLHRRLLNEVAFGSRIGRFCGERFPHNATIGDSMCPVGELVNPRRRAEKEIQCPTHPLQPSGRPVPRRVRCKPSGLSRADAAHGLYRSEPVALFKIAAHRFVTAE